MDEEKGCHEAVRRERASYSQELCLPLGAWKQKQKQPEIYIAVFTMINTLNKSFLDVQ